MFPWFITTDRLLNPQHIPGSLWEPDSETICIPQALADLYRAIVTEKGLVELAKNHQKGDRAVGGRGKKATDKHFATRFDGSLARAQLALLDPRNELTGSSDVYLKSLSGGKLCIIDAPSGAGAASVSFLMCIAELRKAGVLPRMPLRVKLLGAEISADARAYAEDIIGRIRPCLENEGIFVEAEYLNWSVTDESSTTALVRRINLCSEEYPTRLLLVANFNGFLERKGKRKEAEPQLRDLFRFTSGPDCAAIWIEPPMNRAISGGGLFSWLSNKVESAWRRFSRSVKSQRQEPVATAEAGFFPPFTPDHRARLGLAIMSFELEESH